jgi:hypothetical protein
MGLDIYGRIMNRKYTATEAVIILAIYMAVLIAYTIYMA